MGVFRFSFVECKTDGISQSRLVIFDSYLVEFSEIYLQLWLNGIDEILQAYYIKLGSKYNILFCFVSFVLVLDRNYLWFHILMLSSPILNYFELSFLEL